MKFKGESRKNDVMYCQYRFSLDNELLLTPAIHNNKCTLRSTALIWPSPRLITIVWWECSAVWNLALLRRVSGVSGVLGMLDEMLRALKTFGPQRKRGVRISWQRLFRELSCFYYHSQIEETDAREEPEICCTLL